MQQSKFDSVVNQLVDKITKKDGKGLILDLAAELPKPQLQRILEAAKQFDSPEGVEAQKLIQDLIDGPVNTSIAIGEQLKPLDEHIPLSAIRDHSINDTESFIAFVRRYGDPKQSLVMVNEHHARIVIDEHIQRGNREGAICVFRESDEYRAWSRIVGSPMGHRDFYKALINQAHTLANAEILATMASIRVNSTVDIDSDVLDTGERLNVNFKTSKGEGLVKFPKILTVNLPVLDIDVKDHKAWRDVIIRLQIDMPTEPGKGPMFTALSSEWSMLRRDRIHDESEKIADSLAAFTVIRGQFKYQPRSIGRDAVVCQ